MCGRYSLTKKQIRLILKEVDEIVLELLAEIRYNIAPTQSAPVIVQENGKILVRSMRWGLQPSWSKSPLINLQSETVVSKPAFKDSLQQRRCLIPADGFYEWEPGKQPRRFVQEDRSVFCLAGLWENGLDASGAVIPCFTIMTTAAAPTVAATHDRMPLLVKPSYVQDWLSGNFTRAIDDPFVDWKSYPVSSYVNKAGHEGPECIEPPQQASLF